MLGIKVAASTVWEILRAAGIDPAPQRTDTTWAAFLRSPADVLLACDFFETVTLTGARLYVLTVIEQASRRIRVLGATTHPTAVWVAQAARNLVMDLEDARCRARLLIRDRDGKYPQVFDAILADAGIQTVLTGVMMPRMNAVMERWVATCRRKLLDRTLIWNQRHLINALREFEIHYNTHRPHRALGQGSPLGSRPTPINDMERLAQNYFLCASAPAQHAALACCEARRVEFAERRALVLDGLARIGLPVPVPPDGAFYVYFDVSQTGLTSWKFCERALQEAHVALTPGRDFGVHTAETHVRLSYAASADELREGIARLRKFVTTLQ